MRFIVAAGLTIDALLNARWFAGHLSTLGVYDGVAVVLLCASAAAGALLFISGQMIVDRRPAAALFARIGVALSALLNTLQLGFLLAPTNLQPSLRWKAVWAYRVYAAIVAWLAPRVARERRGPT